MIGTMIARSVLSMMNRLFLPACLLLITSLTRAQMTQFPTLQGETVNGSQVSLPTDLVHEWTLVGVAFSRKAQPLLEEWYEPAYLRYVAKHGLFAGAHDADVYFVPLFVGLNKTAYEPSMNKFRKSASPEIVDHVLFSKDDLEGIQNALEMTDKDIPYFFVLDREGRIVHRTKGAFTDAKLDAIEEVLLGN